MKKLLLFCLSMMMLTTCAFAQKATKKASNILVGITPGLGSTKVTMTDGDDKEKCSYNKDFGITLGFERVINGYILLPELHYLRGNLKSYEYNSETIDNYAEDINQIGFIQWFGFTIAAQQRVQVPIMVGIGLDYYTGIPIDKLLMFDYGAKARVKVYITPKFGLFLGAGIQGASASSKSDDQKIRLRNITSELGITFTL